MTSKEKVLFITNRIFLDQDKPEGGVRLCTQDYIKLLQCKFEVLNFLIEFNKRLLYRLKVKLGLNVFEDYSKQDYAEKLIATIEKHQIQKVFINLSTAAAIAVVLRAKFGQNIKIVLCSHGFEAGDFLHQSVRFKIFSSWIRQKTSAWRLGKILQKELEYRTDYFDLVLTVSDIELAIEQWLGAKKVYFVPRVFEPSFIDWQPVMGRIGFIGDLNHYPNYHGLLLLCEEIQRKQIDKIEVRVAGKNCSNLDLLCSRFPFIIPLGYLPNEELIQETSTWMYYLNLVFSYSKGVSTKLAKGMNWGLPILSTKEGNRGYVFKKGGVVTCDTQVDMVCHILSRLDKITLLESDRIIVKEAVESFSDYNAIMDDLSPFL